MRRANDALRRADHVKITWIRVPVDLRVPYRSFQAEAHEQRVSVTRSFPRTTVFMFYCLRTWF
jgi:hypothetical protein